MTIDELVLEIQKDDRFHSFSIDFHKGLIGPLGVYLHFRTPGGYFDCCFGSDPDIKKAYEKALLEYEKKKSLSEGGAA